MTRMTRIFTDKKLFEKSILKSVKIRVIRVIRVLSFLFHAT